MEAKGDGRPIAPEVIKSRAEVLEADTLPKSLKLAERLQKLGGKAPPEFSLADDFLPVVSLRLLGDEIPPHRLHPRAAARQPREGEERALSSKEGVLKVSHSLSLRVHLLSLGA